MTKNIIAIINHRIADRGITQRELAEVTGLVQSHISDVLNPAKNANPTLATLSKLAEAVGLRLSIIDAQTLTLPQGCCHHHKSETPGDFVVHVSHDAYGKRTVSVKEV